MKLTMRKLILLLFFVLVSVSLLRVLKITITASYFPTYLKQLNGNKIILSEKELRFLSDIVIKKSPCNVLVFGVEDQYLKLLPSINKGGSTVFLDEKLLKINGNVDGKQVFRIRYKTSAKDGYKLLRTHPGCSLRMLTWKCKIALSGFPKEVVKTKWDIIVADGPERMGAISVLARNGTNVVVHDVDRAIEKWFSWEFLSEKNLVSSKGKFWNFRIAKNKKLVSLTTS